MSEELKIKTNCQICDVDNWEYLDQFRDPKYWWDRDRLEEGEDVGFKVCKNCSFVTYDYIDIERLREYYDRERLQFNPTGIVTCNRKNLYHDHFLKDFLDEVKDWMVLDIGAAQGYWLDWMHHKYDIPKENLHGTEFSKAYRAWSNGEYGIKLEQDLTEEMLNTKYDLISYYHVLEHCQYPKDELNKVKSMLKPEGYLYLSVPTWFDFTQESSLEPTVSFENYYHLNHVCVFTDNSFENLLKVCGLKVIKKDKYIYGYTVICQIDDSEKSKSFKTDDIDEIKQKLDRQKKAIELFTQGKMEEVIKIEPRYPEAYIELARKWENMKEFKKQHDIIEQGLKEMPDNISLQESLGNVYFQFDENDPKKPKFYSNNIKRSEEILLKVLEKRPSDRCYFLLAMINAVYKKNYKVAIEYYRKLLRVNPHMFQEPVRWIAYCYKELEKNNA
jgi:2-polyprenyl-3-methyl-5-hydroxy-6-metoxy-1,4-benzoquinol methylase